jgi:hypothetical protein
MDKELFTGIIPSPPDSRDFTTAMIARVAGTIREYPISFNTPYPLPVEDQKQAPICGGWTAAEERCITEYGQTGQIQRFSPWYSYTDRFGFYRGDGITARDLLKGMQLYGAVPYDEFIPPEGVTSFPELFDLLWPRIDELRAKARPYRISAFYRIETTGVSPNDIESDIKYALMNGWKVLTVIKLYDSFWKVRPDGIVPIPNTTREKNYGLHLMLTTGWTEDGHTITLNHHGESRGDHGYFHLPFDFPFTELWVATDNVDRWEVELMDKYADANMISPWAKESVARATDLGLMHGDGTRFNPHQNLTREQAAAIAVNLYDKIMADVSALLK